MNPELENIIDCAATIKLVEYQVPHHELKEAIRRLEAMIRSYQKNQTPVLD